MTITKKYYKMQRKDIAIVQFLIEGHEGMATVTTIDSDGAVILVSIMNDFISQMENVINHIKFRYSLNEIDDYEINY